MLLVGVLPWNEFDYVGKRMCIKVFRAAFSMGPVSRIQPKFPETQAEL